MEADCLRVGESKYGYPADLEYTVTGPRDYGAILRDVTDRYDVFHFYFRSFYFSTRSLAFPTGLDMLALRAAGKVVIMNFRGSEVRLHSVFREVSPWHYVDEDPSGLTYKFPEEAQQRYIDFSRGVANRLIVGDPELATYVPGATIVPRSINLASWEPVGPVNDGDPLVIHAPSRRGVKGTSRVLEAVSTLREQGLNFRFQLVEGLGQEEAKELYRQADIVVDQLRIGWYGVLAVEAMALGKPVVAYVREDLRPELEAMAGGSPPLAYADPSDVTEVLASLVQDPDRRKSLGEKGRAFCEATHDSLKVAQRLVEVYQEEMRNPTPVEIGPVVGLIEAQQWRIQRARRRRPAGWLRLPRAFVMKVRDEGWRAAFRRTWQVLLRRKVVPQPGASEGAATDAAEDSDPDLT